MTEKFKVGDIVRSIQTGRTHIVEAVELRQPILKWGEYVHPSLWPLWIRLYGFGWRKAKYFDRANHLTGTHADVIILDDVSEPGYVNRAEVESALSKWRAEAAARRIQSQIWGMSPEKSESGKVSTMDTIGVRFKRDAGARSDIVYSYLSGNFRIEVGDSVVVDSPSNGYVVVDVVDVKRNFRSDKAYKFIVDKVADDEYKKRLNATRRRAELKKALDDKLKNFDDRYKYQRLANEDSEAQRMLQELNELDEIAS